MKVKKENAFEACARSSNAIAYPSTLTSSARKIRSNGVVIVLPRDGNDFGATTVCSGRTADGRERVYEVEKSPVRLCKR
jgi:hypothetical protein